MHVRSTMPFVPSGSGADQPNQALAAVIQLRLRCQNGIRWNLSCACAFCFSSLPH